jgi:hypothetical protein
MEKRPCLHRLMISTRMVRFLNSVTSPGSTPR